MKKEGRRGGKLVNEFVVGENNAADDVAVLQHPGSDGTLVLPPQVNQCRRLQAFWSTEGLRCQMHRNLVWERM